MTAKRKRFIHCICRIFVFFSCLSLFPKVSFENPQINNESRVLFTVAHEMSGTIPYKTLFLADATRTDNTKILTCFPERMELISDGAVLQIRNRYGTARYSTIDSTLAWIQRETSIPTGVKAVVPQSVSPDGKWSCSVKKTDAVSGQLCLRNMATLEEYIINETCSFDYDSVPVKWSPDSSIFIYEKDRNIYFCSPKAFHQNVQLGEDFRKIGEGTIQCVAWAGAKYIVYIQRDVVYKISVNELYTRGLYGSLVGIGSVAGRLPMAFNPASDRFFVSPTLDRIITISGNAVISSYRMNGTGSEMLPSVYSRPFSDASGVSVGYDCFFCGDGTQILWVHLIGIDDGKRKSGVYRLSSELSRLAVIEDCGAPVVSPDGKAVAFSSGNALLVYELQNWQKKGELAGEKVVSYVWSRSNAIYVGGTATVREWKADENGFFPDSGKMIFLSSVQNSFWKPHASSVVCAQGLTEKDTFYDYDQFRNVWLTSAEDSKTAAEFTKKAAESAVAVQNGKFRVYIGPADNPLYANALFIRNFVGNGTTRALYPETVSLDEPRKKVALIFDAVDRADGITNILSVLSEYRVKATFFLNGAFIRRFPQECRQIVAAGHECASMYFSTADLTEKGFIIDEEFIRRGLARNEDEFYAVTGKELNLLWHAPFYKANESIKKAGELSGYRYVDASRLSLDSRTLADSNGWYLSADDIIRFFAENVSDGMVIPVTVGMPAGSRDDYLYEKLGLLIGNLLEAGCDFELVREIQ